MDPETNESDSGVLVNGDHEYWPRSGLRSAWHGTEQHLITVYKQKATVSGYF